MFVHTPSKSLILKVRDPFMIRELIPDASRTVLFPDGHNLQVKWTLDTAKLLRNVGIEAPSPIVSFYGWPKIRGTYAPFDHQVLMAAFATLNDYNFNVSEMGTGKTAATLWALDFLMQIGVCKRALILCPISSMKETWAKDIFDTIPHRTWAIVHGTPTFRMKSLNKAVDLYIANHDGIDLEYLAKEVRKRSDIDTIVVDELDAFCNHQTDRWRFLKWVAETKQRLWMIGGTPCPNAPTDAWALSTLVNPGLLNGMSFSRFRDETMMPSEIRKNKLIPKLGATQRAYEIMQPGIRFLKKDCLTLPPMIGPRDVPTTLSAQQKQMLKEMRNEMRTFAETTQIDAVNGADKLIKVRQILAGAIKDPQTETYIRLDCKQRVRDLRTLIAHASARVLVIVPFTGMNHMLVDELAKPDKHLGLPGYNFVSLNGEVKAGKQRSKAIQQIKVGDDIKGGICHPQVMSHGLNFVEADTLIFYAPVNSNRQYQQVIDRPNRPGQKNTMYLLHMLAHPTEASIYRSVSERGAMQMSVLDLYTEFVNMKDEEL